MPIRLLALDLDGTLVNPRGEISPANRKAMLKASRRGVEIVIVTGRRYHSASRFLEQMPAPVTVISSNGARIGDSEGRAFYRNLLPRAVAREIMEVSASYWGYMAAFFDVPGRGQIVMHQNAAPDGLMAWYMKTCPECLLQTTDPAASMELDPLHLTFAGPPAAIEPLELILRASPDASKFHLAWTKYLARNLSLLDAMNWNCSKGAGLAYWSERIGIEPEEVVAIGDNMNDLEMLQFAGQPVLMANHNFDPVPEGWAITSSNNDDGVARAIEQYVLG